MGCGAARAHPGPAPEDPPPRHLDERQWEKLRKTSSRGSKGDFCQEPGRVTQAALNKVNELKGTLSLKLRNAQFDDRPETWSLSDGEERKISNWADKVQPPSAPASIRPSRQTSPSKSRGDLASRRQSCMTQALDEDEDLARSMSYVSDVSPYPQRLTDKWSLKRLQQVIHHEEKSPRQRGHPRGARDAGGASGGGATGPSSRTAALQAASSPPVSQQPTPVPIPPVPPPSSPPEATPVTVPTPQQPTPLPTPGTASGETGEGDPQGCGGVAGGTDAGGQQPRPPPRCPLSPPTARDVPQTQKFRYDFLPGAVARSASGTDTNQTPTLESGSKAVVSPELAQAEHTPPAQSTPPTRTGIVMT